MKEVMSAVWLQGLDASYLREQVEKAQNAVQLYVCFIINGVTTETTRLLQVFILVF